MDLDLRRIPFSRFGSYLAFSLLDEQAVQGAGLYLRSLRGPATGGRPMQEVLRIELVRDGQALSGAPRATFTSLSLETEAGYAELCLPDPESARLRLQGVEMRLSMPAGAYDNIIPAPGQAWRLTVNTVVEAKLQFSALQGRIEIEAPWEAERCQHIAIRLIPAEDGAGEFAIEEGEVDWPKGRPILSFQACQQQVEAELEAFTARLPRTPERYAEARGLAGYVLWSCVVAPSGHIARPTVYASKNGMIGSWSWDHVFHTLALAEGHPSLAWDQLMALFDHQAESGALPDLINDRLVSWSFCKPPVHGWLLKRMLEHSQLLTPERLAEIYPRLAKWTGWWLNQRDDDGDGLPQCNHGNDSGWDNSTVFVQRPPIETPDIAAYLALQMECLATMAARLGRAEEAANWAARSTQLIQRLLTHFWQEDRFVAFQIPGHQMVASESLQLFLPLLLGKRLPLEIRQKLISRLTAPGAYRTPYGLATEKLDSPYYRPKGYWRGPIWPAPMLILIDGLAACGESDLAADLRRQFCDLVNAAGMAENFDALTGEGYHDFHFSWTASIFLVLAHESEETL